MHRVSFKGIILAALFVLVFDLLTGVVMTAFMGGGVLRDGMTEQQMNDAMAAMTLSIKFLLGSAVLGTLSTVGGGYVAARIAKKDPYINAGVIGLIGIVIGVFMAKHFPLWYNVLGFALVLPAALLGGHLARSQTERKA